jgi:hypothetical protein
MKSTTNCPPPDLQNTQHFKARQSSSKEKSTRSRAKGKIAQLPKEQRDIINRLLDDGATYKAVVREMDKHGVSLNGENISNWFNGPYQNHVQHQEWLAELRRARESAADLDELSSTPQFQANLLHLAMTEIFRALHEAQSKSDPSNYIRLFNTLARLSREALALRKYDDVSARKNALL